MRLPARKAPSIPLVAVMLLLLLAISGGSGNEPRKPSEGGNVHDKTAAPADDLLLTIHRLGHPSIVIGVRG